MLPKTKHEKKLQEYWYEKGKSDGRKEIREQIFKALEPQVSLVQRR